jgi:hypothetical protein
MRIEPVQGSDTAALRELQTLPAIGPRLAEGLLLLGVRSPADLRGRDPEALYDELQTELGPVDRCVLYAYRCAVHVAEHGTDDPELARWWNWKDGGRALPRARAAAGGPDGSTPSR